MRSRRLLISVTSSLIYLGLPIAIGAADEGVPTPDPVPILGGEIVEPCGFPTAVSMAGLCTGTLVHPRLVVYAAHCGDEVPWIRFGDRIEDAPGFEVVPELCQTHPIGEFGFGTDAAFCRLAEPVEGIPIAPPLMGCEAEAALQVGQPVTVVGYGLSDDPEEPNGIKRYLDTEITALSWDEVFIGGENEGTCYGDSGGPTYTQASDGSWRSFGITSWGQPGCGFGAYLSTVVHNIEWIETASEVDITPCHDALGQWDPSPECTGFDLELHAAGGDWEAGCDFGAMSGWVGTCGEPFDPDLVDEVPPVLTIVSPLSYSRTELPEGDSTVLIPVEIEADDPGGWGVGEVELVIERNGQEQARVFDMASPFGFDNLVFTEGVWTLRVEASDRAGNLGESEDVIIGVGVDPPPAPEPSDDTTDGGSGDTGGLPTESTTGADDESEGSEGDGAGVVSDGSGCGCRGGNPGGGGGGGGGLGLLALGLLGLIRRRRGVLGLGLVAAVACGDDLPEVSSDGGSSTGGASPMTGEGMTSSASSDGGSESEGSSEDGEPPIVGCGNGIVEDDERCDDGNEVDGDGCSAACEPSGELLADLKWPQDSELEALGNDIEIAADGTIVVAGFQEIAEGGSAAIVLGLSPELSILWSTEIQGGSPDDFVNARAISIADEGSIWVAGSSRRQELGEDIEEPWIARLDSGGVMQWSVVVPGDTLEEEYGDVVALPGGDAVAVGSVRLPEGSLRRLVRRHDTGGGSEVWTHVDAVEDPESAGLSVTLSDAGHSVVGGWVLGAQGYRDLRLERYDEDGVEVDTTIFGEPLTSYYARSIDLDPSGEVAVCGSVVRAIANTAMIGRFALGMPSPSVWLQRIETTGEGTTSCQGLAVDDQGRVAIAGFAFHADSGFDPMVGRLATDGEILWSNRVVPSEGFAADFAEDVALDENGDLIVVGRTEIGNTAQLWVGHVRG